jgi:hypothetical protein
MSYAVLVIAISIYFLPLMRFVLSGDEGTMLAGAERVVHGQVFARDFFEVMGPGTFYLLAAWFKVFGVSFVTARAYLFVNFIATTVIIYFLARRVCLRLAVLPVVVMAGTYFGLFSVGVSYHFDGNLCALLAVVCLVLWHANQKAILLAASGVSLAAATCIMQPEGVLLAGAVCVWFMVRDRRLSKWAPALAMVAGSYVLVIGVVLTYFWSRGALENLVYANYIFPRQDYGSANSVYYGHGLFEVIWKVWTGVFGHSLWGRTVSGFLILPEILVGLVPALAPILGARFKFGLRSPELLLLWLSGYAIWLSEIHRPDAVHLAYGSPILLVLFAHFLEQYKSPIARGASGLIYFSGGALAVWSFIAVTVGAKPIVTREGTMSSIDRSASRVLEYLDDNVKAGSEIFVYPYSPNYYFFSDTTNPTRYSILMYGYNTTKQLHEVTESLESHAVRYVVWDTNFVGKGELEAFPRAVQPRADQLIVEPYLLSHYRKVADYSGVWIMERDAEPNAADR